MILRCGNMLCTSIATCVPRPGLEDPGTCLFAHPGIRLEARHFCRTTRSRNASGIRLVGNQVSRRETRRLIMFQAPGHRQRARPDRRVDAPRTWRHAPGAYLERRRRDHGQVERGPASHPTSLLLGGSAGLNRAQGAAWPDATMSLRPRACSSVTNQEDSSFLPDCRRCSVRWQASLRPGHAVTASSLEEGNHAGS